MESKPVRVMLVDDHIFWRGGVRQIVDAEEDLTVVAEACDGQEAEHKALMTRPDIILMDVNMPKVSGVDATKALVYQIPDVRIVMLTVSDTDENLFESIRAGAIGFLTKDLTPDELTDAIRAAMRGEASVSPYIAGRMMKYIQQGNAERHQPAADLTEREDEILSMIAQGARDREIGYKLFISESTVKKHVQNVLRKLHARNRVEAVSRLERLQAERNKS